MPASRIRTDYDALAQIASGFGEAASNARQTLHQLQSQKEVLQGSDWAGAGADRFYAEMDSALLPMMDRLVNALDAAQRTTTHISKIIKQSEADAAAVLRGQDSGGPAYGAPESGGPADNVLANTTRIEEWLDKPALRIGREVARKAREKMRQRAEVRALIDAGDHQGAIDLAVKAYDLDLSAVNGKITFDPNLTTEGKTMPDGRVVIGPDAFSSPGILASTIGHEAVHARQNAEGRGAKDAQTLALNDLECYAWELDNAKLNGLTRAERQDIKERRLHEYSKLNKENQRKVDAGSHGGPP
jgi:WXG100 family type VII secretion target